MRMRIPPGRAARAIGLWGGCVTLALGGCGTGAGERVDAETRIRDPEAADTGEPTSPPDATHPTGDGTVAVVDGPPAGGPADVGPDAAVAAEDAGASRSTSSTNLGFS